jgi:hypothetical protein
MSILAIGIAVEQGEGSLKSPSSMSVTPDEGVDPFAHESDADANLVEQRATSPSSDHVETEAANVFARASELVFEDGMESTFSRALIRFVQNLGDTAVKALALLIGNDRVDREAAGEALRWLGRMVHSPTHESRRGLLEQCLFSSSVAVRDGAILGLTSMGDPHAVSYLQRAWEHHGNPETRSDMEQAIGELQAVGN